MITLESIAPCFAVSKKQKFSLQFYDGTTTHGPKNSTLVAASDSEEEAIDDAGWRMTNEYVSKEEDVVEYEEEI